MDKILLNSVMMNVRSSPLLAFSAPFSLQITISLAIKSSRQYLNSSLFFQSIASEWTGAQWFLVTNPSTQGLYLACYPLQKLTCHKHKIDTFFSACKDQKFEAKKLESSLCLMQKCTHGMQHGNYTPQIIPRLKMHNAVLCQYATMTTCSNFFQFTITTQCYQCYHDSIYPRWRKAQ